MSGMLQNEGIIRTYVSNIRVSGDLFLPLDNFNIKSNVSILNIIKLYFFQIKIKYL